MKLRLKWHKLFGLFILVFFSLGFSQENPNENTNKLSIPSPKIVQLSDSEFLISASSTVTGTDLLATFNSALSSIKNTIKTFGSKKNSGSDIVFQLLTDSISTINEFKKYIQLEESYAIQFSAKKVVIQSGTKPGLLNGLTTLEYLIIKNQGKLKSGLIIDYPDIKNRVIHIRLCPGAINSYINFIRFARFNHFNKLILLLDKGVRLKSIKYWKNPEALSIQEFKDLVEYAKENGLEVIPELKLLSHQEKFFGNAYPELMYNKNTYNPLDKAVYNYVFAAIDEIIELTGASKFHIGHDEVAGSKKSDFKKGKLCEHEKQLAAKLFLKDVVTLNNYLNSKNIETWMWGDMLLSDDQFPSLKGMRGIHGYNDNLINELPKNITICDWHYNDTQKDFPSIYEFAKAGFKVYGATWVNKETIRRFAKYITTMPENVEGMIATTWYKLNGPKKELAIDIVNYSGEPFWNAKEVTFSRY